MKKNFFKYAMMLFVALVGIASMASCKGSGDDDNNELVGTWVQENDASQYMTFANGNTLYYYKYTSTLKSVAKSTYSYNGSIMKVTFSGPADEKSNTQEASVKVSGNTMTMTAGSQAIQLKKVTAPVSVAQLEQAWKAYLSQD